MLQQEFPLSEYHNRIAVTSATTAADVLTAADELLGGACLGIGTCPSSTTPWGGR
jgi:hypothetical protein